MKLPANWYLFADRSERHSAQLGDEGRWPGALVALRGAAAVSLAPQNLPPGWYENNRADGDYADEWQPLPPAFLNYGAQQGQRMRTLAPIGPTDQSLAQGAALQAALAASLRGLSTGTPINPATGLPSTGGR